MTTSASTRPAGKGNLKKTHPFSLIRSLGLLLLFAAVGLSSCQALVVAVSPAAAGSAFSTGAPK